MRKKRNSIDELFRNGLKDFSTEPAGENWNEIKKELEERRKKPVIPFWYRASGFAACLMVLFSLGYLFWPDTTSQPNLTQSKNTEIEKGKNPKFNSEKNTLFSNDLPDSAFVLSANDKVLSDSDFNFDLKNPSLVHTSSKRKNSVQNLLQISFSNPGNRKSSFNPNKNQLSKDEEVKNKSSQETRSQVISKENRHIQTKRNYTFRSNNNLKPKKLPFQPILKAELIPEDKLDTFINDSLSQRKSLLAIAEENKKAEKNAKDSKSGEKATIWSIKPNVSPVYFNTLGSQNILDQNLNNYASKSEISFSYGINLAFNVSERVKIRSGISKVEMSYSTENIAFTSSVKGKPIAGLISDQDQQINALPKNKIPEKTLKNDDIEMLPTSGSLFEADINQQMGFIEVPVEVEYALVSERFQVNLIGGASTLFLNNNRVELQSESGITPLGRSAQLNNTSFSANFGLGMGYQLSQQFNLSLEPTFKYQLNTFSGNQNINPYFFGVYSGISFSF